ncbi:MAG: acyltransferase [Oscillospiraceae bacterium]|nr:acyltransferase [Oscillospiraceae bacterium]
MQQPATLASKRKYYLDIARVIAIVSISLNHAVNRSYQNYNGQMAEFYSIPLWSTLIKTVISVFSRIGVPLFLMITGVLILNKKMETQEDIKKFYKHNLLSMFITTEIWYVIIYWYLVLFGSSNNILETKGIAGAIGGMFETMLFQNQVTFGSMWYMPMILCLYTTLPFVVMVKDKLTGSKLSAVVFLPAIILYLNNMVLPAVNAFLRMHDLPVFSSELREIDLFSTYYLYILVGYFVGKGLLEKWKLWLVAGLAALTFAVCCGVQLYAYSQPYDYLVAYSFPLLPICAGLIFELVRRGAHRLKAVEKPVTYLSRIAFGIYFVHIMIMTALNEKGISKLLNYAAWEPAVKMIFLEAVSIAGSIVLIWLLSKIKPLKKYLFLIK